MHLMVLEASKRLSGAFDRLVVLGGHVQEGLRGDFPSTFLAKPQRNIQ